MTQAITLTAKIPIMIDPVTPRLSRIAIIIKPTAAKITGIDVTSPKPTRVAGLSTTTPAFFNPMIARNKPIPAPTPNFMLFGILLMIHCLAGVTDNKINTKPATKTAVKAC